MIGYSLSPGGLLLPYHLGALSSLEYNGMLDPQHTPIAGSSAGAIATMSHGCGIDSRRVLEATIKVSNACEERGGARGRLLPLLQDQMQNLVDEKAFAVLQDRPGIIGLGYREVFPRGKNFLQTEFVSREDLFRATSFSCMFPFFSTNFPCILDTSSGFIPRLMVDGYFSVPRDRFGCPDFELTLEVSNENDVHDNADTDNGSLNDGKKESAVDRTVAIAVFPQKTLKITGFAEEDCISPQLETEEDIARYFRLATQASSREELTQVYEEGWKDAEAWCRREKSKDH